MNKPAQKKPLSKQNQALPKKPELTILKKSDEEMENFDVTKTDYQLNIDAIAGLAFIENVKSGQTKDQWNGKGWNKSEKQEEEVAKTKTHLRLVEEHQEVDNQNNNIKVFFYLLIIAGSLFGTFKLLNSTSEPSKKMAKLPTEENISNEKIKTVAPKRVTKNANTVRPRKRSIRRAPAAASFKDSEVFKKHNIRKLEDNPLRNEDDEYKDDYNDDYDNGRESLDNDPIRKDASKGVVNPDDDYYSDEEKDFYEQEEGAREPSSNDDGTWVDAASEKNKFEQINTEEVYQDDYQDEYPEDNNEEAPFEDAEQF